MPAEHHLLSPARRAQRCRIGLLACLVFVTGASLARDGVRSDLTPPVQPQTKYQLSDSLASDMSVNLELNSGVASGQSLATSSTSFEMASSKTANSVFLF